MKKRLLLLPALLLLGTNTALGAAPDTVTIPMQDYKAILQELRALRDRVDQLEKKSPTGKQTAAAVPGSVKKDIDDIYDTLDEVETKTLRDKINFGAELRTRVDNFKVKNHTYFSTGTVAKKESNDNSWSNRFRLNMDAEIRKNLKFTGRLTMYKNFADSDTSDPGIIGDANYAHLQDNSNIKVDRAYVDWVPSGLPVPLAITFGRHPSSEGPPMEFKENRKRQSTYPSLLFDGEADGVVATIGLERYTGLANSGLRFAWGKSYQEDDDIEPYLDKPGGLDDSNVFAAFLESAIPGVDNSLMVFSALRVNDLVADFQGAIPGINSNDNANVGDMDLYGIHMQAAKVAGSSFDVFLSLGLNESHPNGKTISYGSAKMGLLNNDGESDHSGWAVYTGFRYTFDWPRLNHPKFGFEYNHGSDYWFSFTQGSAELYNKLAARGDAYDFYYIQPFNSNLFMRLGYTYIDYNYKMSGFHVGDMGGSNETLRDAYMLIDCRF